MKKMMVKQRLIISFLIIAVITAVVGSVGIAGLCVLNSNENKMYSYSVTSNYANSLIDNIQQQRIAARDMMLNMGDDQKLNSLMTQLTSLDEEYETLYSYLHDNLTTETAQSFLGTINHTYESSYMPLANELRGAALASDKARTDQMMIELVAPIKTILENANGLIDYAISYTGDVSDKDEQTAYTLIAIVAALAVISVASAIVLGLNLSRGITNPLLKMKSVMDQVGNTGSLAFSEEEINGLRDEAEIKDEIGQSISSSLKMVMHFKKASDVLHRVSDGDLTAEFDNLSENDTIGVSLNTMLDSLNSMFGEIHMASRQVASGAGQVSQGAQELAAGSTQQAASIEEFSATLAELQETTNHNAESAIHAQEANAQAAEMLRGSINSMNEMLAAMRSIDESSSSITKVIKVIDDIAFQTNILALNAAVEAARAGQHGRGFAVVADEVRNLAAKSAEAARETAELIEDSSERVKEGNQIVIKTNTDLEAVVKNAHEITDLIEQVAVESAEQSKSIKEINHGIEQISAVVQSNSATSEQSAAASEQMTAQSVTLEEIIGRFKLRGDGKKDIVREDSGTSAAIRSSIGFSVSADTGKYGSLSA